MRDLRPPRERRVAGGMALAWSVVIATSGLLGTPLLPLLVAGSQRGYCENIDHPGPCSPVAPFAVPGLALVAFGTWCAVASVAFRRGRPWARPAVVATFALWAGAALAGALGAAATRPDHPAAMLTWLALLAYCATVAVIAARDPLASDAQDSPKLRAD